MKAIAATAFLLALFAGCASPDRIQLTIVTSAHGQEGIDIGLPATTSYVMVDPSYTDLAAAEREIAQDSGDFTWPCLGRSNRDPSPDCSKWTRQPSYKAPASKEAFREPLGDDRWTYPMIYYPTDVGVLHLEVPKPSAYLVSIAGPAGADYPSASSFSCSGSELGYLRENLVVREGDATIEGGRLVVRGDAVIELQWRAACNPG